MAYQPDRFDEVPEYTDQRGAHRESFAAAGATAAGGGRRLSPLLWVAGLVLLIAADIVLAHGTHWGIVLVGVALWGLHMGMTQGLLATMVAQAAPADLRGTAFGVFNLVSGVATLVSSVVAGFLWDRVGAAATFYAGAAFSAATIVLLVCLRTSFGAGQAH